MGNGLFMRSVNCLVKYTFKTDNTYSTSSFKWSEATLNLSVSVIIIHYLRNIITGYNG